MRRAAQLVLIFLASAFVTLAIMAANLGIGPQRHQPASEAPTDKTNPYARSATARMLATSGRLHEAQDAYLEILQTNPVDPGAMEGLVAVRRALAADDPAALRREAAAYRQMLARGGETQEHYSRDSLEMLVVASLRAAAAIESTRSGAHRAGTTPTTRPDRHTSRVTKGLQPAAPLPPQAAATHPQPPPPAAPVSPAVPAAGADKPAAGADSPAASADKPAAGQPSPAPADVQETVAVLTPPGEPAVAPSQGSLVGIDCQKRAFVLHGANGDEEYLTTPTVTIYVRGAPSRRLPDFCGLESYLGHAVTAWTVSGGDRRIAKEVSVAP
jgi:hypothetical protein